MMLYNFSDFLHKEMKIKINVAMHHYHICYRIPSYNNFFYVLTLN